MSCAEFLALDDVVKPKVVYWAVGYNSEGKPKEAVVDVEATERLIPAIVTACQAAPKQSFWDKLKGEVKKIL